MASRKPAGYIPGMALSLWGFLRETSSRAWASAKKAKSLVASAVGLLVTACSFLLGYHWEIVAMTWIPPIAFLVVLIGVLFYHAFRIHLDRKGPCCLHKDNASRCEPLAMMPPSSRRRYSTQTINVLSFIRMDRFCEVVDVVLSAKRLEQTKFG